VKTDFGYVCLVCAVLAAAVSAASGMTVSLDPSVDSAAVGEQVTWTASTDAPEANTLWYRFRERPIGDNSHTLRDFGPVNWLVWAAAAHEGAYEIEVTARDLDTGETATAKRLFRVASRVTDGPVVSPLASHPLVLLYSAPACAPGNRMKVVFQTPGSDPVSTNTRRCRLGSSMNFYLAGLYASSGYTAHHVIDTGSEFVAGPDVQFTTPALDVTLPQSTVVQGQVPAGGEILLQTNTSSVTWATDLNGNPVWYYPGWVSNITEAAAGGRFLGFLWDGEQDRAHQILREFDLAGITLRETNAARISEQLAAMGKGPINAFHHDARRLPDGKIMVLAASERILTDVQGPGDLDVITDMILVLDSDLQVVWTWDALDWLDPSRPAVLGEVCVPGGGGCPPLFLSDTANDWLHGNSIQLTPDGSILYSARHQDWLVKIDYRNGDGDGSVLWRLGRDGDFQTDSTDPFPWFSHQHDASFLAGDNATLIVFDNGNTRHSLDPAANSRGQVIRIDEGARTASFALNADLGAYSIALGSAAALENGNYHFDAGWINDTSGQPSYSKTVEVTPSGDIVYALAVQATNYRTFRMRDLYTPR
jgi:arylsulfate sulfotransferase